jgi:hypothetical protein
MTMSRGRHDVFVVEDPVGEYRVIPAVAIVGNKVNFCNLTGHDVEVEFPEALGKQKKNLAKNKDSDNEVDFGVSPARGLYDYSVTVGVSVLRIKAKGNSDPKIIVDA